MAGAASLQRWLDDVSDLSQTFLLEEKLRGLPIRRGDVSLKDICQRLQPIGGISKAGRESLTVRILLYHWTQVVLKHGNRELVKTRLCGLPVLGLVSLRALMVAVGKGGGSRMGRDALIVALAGAAEDTAEDTATETVTKEVVTHWLHNLGS